MLDEDVWQRTVTVIEREERAPQFKIYRPDGTALVPAQRRVGFELPHERNKKER